MLKVIFEFILNLAYSLFTAAIGITLSLDSSFRQSITDYIGRGSNKAYVITLVVLGVLVLALNKLYVKDKHLSPTIRKVINFIEDLLRLAIFVIMLIFITTFVLENIVQTTLVAAYGLYILAGFLFVVLNCIKWIYFFCG